MRKIFLKSLTLAAALTVALAVSSCCEGDTEITTLPQDQPTVTTPQANVFNSTTAVPDGYSLGIQNQTNGNTYLVANENGDNSGNINRIGFVLGNNTGASAGNGQEGSSLSYGTAIFADSKVRSITVNGITYTFHENENGKVDVAITSGSTTELFSDVAEARLLGNSGNGSSFSERLTNAFSNINSAIDVIYAANGLVDSSSPLYQYIQGSTQYLAYLKDDTNTLKDNSTTANLVNNPTNAPTDVNTDELGSANDTADNNTNTGNGAIASGRGALKVTLTWFFGSDIDLHVYEPGYVGSVGQVHNIGHLWYSDKQNSFTDGYLDIDNTRGYYINPITRETNMSLSAVENIYWPESPKDGRYDIYLDYFSGTVSGNCNVTIYLGNKSIYSEDVTMTRTDRSKYIVSVTYPQGEITTGTRSADAPSILDYRLFPKKN